MNETDLKPVEFVAGLEHTPDGVKFFDPPCRCVPVQATNMIELTFLDLPTRKEWPHLLRPTLAPIFREQQHVRCRVPMNGSLLSFTLLVDRIESNVRLTEPCWTAGGEPVRPVEVSRGPHVVTGRAVAVDHEFLTSGDPSIAKYEPALPPKTSLLSAIR